MDQGTHGESISHVQVSECSVVSRLPASNTAHYTTSWRSPTGRNTANPRSHDKQHTSNMYQKCNNAVLPGA